MKTMSVKVFARIACLIMAVAMAVSLVGCGVDITSVNRGRVTVPLCSTIFA